MGEDNTDISMSQGKLRLFQSPLLDFFLLIIALAVFLAQGIYSMLLHRWLSHKWLQTTTAAMQHKKWWLPECLP